MLKRRRGGDHLDRVVGLYYQLTSAHILVSSLFLLTSSTFGFFGKKFWLSVIPAKKRQRYNLSERKSGGRVTYYCFFWCSQVSERVEFLRISLLLLNRRRYIGRSFTNLKNKMFVKYKHLTTSRNFFSSKNLKSHRHHS